MIHLPLFMVRSWNNDMSCYTFMNQNHRVIPPKHPCNDDVCAGPRGDFNDGVVCRPQSRKAYDEVKWVHAWAWPMRYFNCDQAALQMVFSVRLSVCLSVRLSLCQSVTPFWLCSYHRIIMKFSGVIINNQSKVHAKGEGQRWRSQRSQPNLTVSGL